METNVYKVEFFIEGTEHDAYGLRRNLAQSVSHEYDIRRVFGVTVCMEDNPNKHPASDTLEAFIDGK